MQALPRSLRAACLAALIAGGPALAQTVPQAPAPAIVEVPAEADEPRPGPPPPLPDLSDPNSRTGEALTEPGASSSVPKALRNSGSKAGGPANDLNPGAEREAPAPPKGALGEVLTGRSLYHGNYCGAGQRGEGLPATDLLDAACMRHDACYDAAGYRSCACDRTLRDEAASVSEDPGVAPEIRRRALSVSEAAGLMECKAP
ncbi:MULTISPECIES: hypothetical protein [Methylobacterium]|uniref:Phospholipase A2 domain-containing protein n=1 Tax=Methylobacterium jeotgali TaxID=381630 RepID=A0ABQ4T1L5_9HYPH|nr:MULTISPECIES: hypothetical protein [Methylobacterium]GBU19184.1 hypothetical protein AwMethylo_33990 [Methylobacterium sp.]GJE08148.1 hypothetical protein AOPFMNJM_3482 [Methylobacterium jeotgali]